MGLELIIFIVAILFGILLYWRESNSNTLYRTFNKIVNAKALQMKAESPIGFVYKQKLLLRFVFVTFFFLAIAVILQFLTPFKLFGSYDGISAFFSVVVGTLIGTYIATFVIKSGKIIEEKGSSLGNIVEDVIEKGKDIIEDVTSKENAKESLEQKDEIKDDLPDNDQKSARERLKDKGLM